MNITNLSVNINGKEILKNVNISTQKCELIHIVGPNGCGKSTLFKSIMGYGKYEGLISILPKDVAIVSDYSAVPNDVNVLDVIKISNQYSKVSNDDKSWYDIMKIKKIENNNISTLSKGEKRKLEIYLAITSGKKVLILDEVTNGLDKNSIDDFIKLLKEIISNMSCTILMTTHNLREISEISEISVRYFFYNPVDKNFSEKYLKNYDSIKNEYIKYIEYQ